MSDRITIKHLEATVARMNKVTGSPLEAYSKGPDGHYHAQVGNFHIGRAYGGYSLQRMSNESGGVTTPFGNGFGTARELYDQMQAWLAGYECAKSSP